jgi:hypothetical protein
MDDGVDMRLVQKGVLRSIFDFSSKAAAAAQARCPVAALFHGIFFNVICDLTTLHIKFFLLAVVCLKGIFSWQLALHCRQ